MTKERMTGMESMNLIDKVLQGTEHCAAMNGLDCGKCAYLDDSIVKPYCTQNLAADCNKVIKQLQADNQRLDKENQKLLEQMAELNTKEQPRFPKDIKQIKKDGAVIGWCVECGSLVIKPDKRCRECGQAQKWEYSTPGKEGEVNGRRPD